jgi:hypothetical protein
VYAFTCAYLMLLIFIYFERKEELFYCFDCRYCIVSDGLYVTEDVFKIV